MKKNLIKKNNNKYALFLVLMLMALKGMAEVTYGADPTCDFQIEDTTIQELIDLGHDDIKLTTDVTYFENLNIL